MDNADSRVKTYVYQGGAFISLDSWVQGTGGEKYTSDLKDKTFNVAQSELNQKIFSEKSSNNKLDWTAILSNTYIDNKGVETSNARFCASAKIAAKKGDAIYFCQYSDKLDFFLTVAIELCEYDSTGKYIGKVTTVENDKPFKKILVSNTNTASVRINFTKSSTATSAVVYINTRYDSYEPYIAPYLEIKADTKINDLGCKIGDTGLLNTLTKTSCVDAINEVSGKTSKLTLSEYYDKHNPLFVDMLTDVLIPCGGGFSNLFNITLGTTFNPKFDEPSTTLGVDSWHNNAWFKVNGRKGDNFVTFVSAGNADMTDIVQKATWSGAVIQRADGEYRFCLAKYKDNSSLYVYPSLEEDLTEAEFGQAYAEDLHLTRRGYYAYSAALFEQLNPKYCEKNFYLEKFRPNITENPFKPFGANIEYVGRMHIENLSSATNGFISIPAYTCLTFGAAINESMFQSTPIGVSWELNVSGREGFVEVYVGGSSAVAKINKEIERKTGEEIFVELWLDGKLHKRIEKKTNIAERICIDYKGASTATLKIGLNGVLTIDNAMLISIGAVTWWINNRFKKTTHDNIFLNQFIIQAFDSWGVYDDGASGKKLKELIDKEMSMSSSYENISVGGTTSLYWKHWFENKVKSKNPSMVLCDYGINDFKGKEYAGDVVGPDKKTYPNINTKEYFSRQMKHFIKLVSNNNILPVVCSAGLAENGKAIEWHIAAIDSLAQKV